MQENEKVDTPVENKGIADPPEEAPVVQPPGEEEAIPEAEPETPAEDEKVSPEVLAQLQEELAAMQETAQENLDGWQRSLADFSNYKKRVERDQAMVYHQAVGSVVLKYLDIADDLERALANRPDSGDGATWAEGIELIHRKLAGLLEAEGVERIEAEGQFFDPKEHEALSQEENPDFESGQVIAVVKNGYRIGGRIIRPALVRVAQ